MANIVIVEDNIRHLMRLESIVYDIARQLKLRVQVQSAASLDEFESLVKETPLFDLYFLDLEMGYNKQAGFDLAKKIRRQNPYSPIVFTTTLSEAMPLAFRMHVSALDFITKDLDEDIFRERIKECIEQVLTKKKQTTEDILYYTYQGRTGINLPFSDILFIQTTGESHRLLLFGITLRKEFYGSMSEIIALDTQGHLYQADRSTIININNLIDINVKKNELVFYNGTTCFVSRSSIRRLRAILKERNKKKV